MDNNISFEHDFGEIFKNYFLSNKVESEEDGLFNDLFETFEDINTISYGHLEKEASEYHKRINNVFKRGYELRYYDSFRILQKLFPESDVNNEEIDVFNEKLKLIISSQGNTLKHSEQVYKLVDYLMLECSRYEHNKPVRDSIEEIKSLTQIVSEQKEQIDDLLEKSKNTNNQAITIFTIFSAIIMTFSGGISFTSSILQVSGASAYRIVFIIALVGFALFNTIFMLLFVISRIIEKPIKIKCKHKRKICENESGLICGNDMCTQKNKKKSTFLCKLREEYPYIFWVDFLLMAVMVVDFVLWAIFKPDNEVGEGVLTFFSELFKLIVKYPCGACVVAGIIILIVIIIVLCKKFKAKKNKSVLK